MKKFRLVPLDKKQEEFEGIPAEIQMESLENLENIFIVRVRLKDGFPSQQNVMAWAHAIRKVRGQDSLLLVVPKGVEFLRLEEIKEK